MEQLLNINMEIILYSFVFAIVLTLSTIIFVIAYLIQTAEKKQQKAETPEVLNDWLTHDEVVESVAGIKN
jgi:Na+-translocating ferredoxin:NAD+ oxidoreductase RnfG subunit